MAALPLKTPRTCSQCGNNGHNARTCTEAPVVTATTTGGGFMLFGVRVTAAAEQGSSPFSTSSSSSLSFIRKSMSMTNLSQYEQQPQDSSGNVANVGGAGYASDDAVHASGSRTRERKRGIPWTEEEHKLFLIGLKRVGKGDWRGISRNFVKTRTPTQVASHAQKYFLRRTNANRRRRRSSLFDITTDTVSSSSIEDQSLLNQESQSQSKQGISSVSKPIIPPTTSKQTCLVPLIPIPPSSKMASLNLNHSPSTSSTSTPGSNRDRDSLEPLLSLKLSSEPSDDQESVSGASSFGGFNGNGDSIISVA